ncbi:MAG: hypothetical protein ACLQHW_18235 [bacterium]
MRIDVALNFGARCGKAQIIYKPVLQVMAVHKKAIDIVPIVLGGHAVFAASFDLGKALVVSY